MDEVANDLRATAAAAAAAATALQKDGLALPQCFKSESLTLFIWLPWIFRYDRQVQRAALSCLSLQGEHHAVLSVGSDETVCPVRI